MIPEIGDPVGGGGRYHPCGRSENHCSEDEPMKSVTFYRACFDAGRPTTPAQPFKYQEWVTIVCRQLIVGGVAWQFVAHDAAGAADRICRAAYEVGETPMAAADMLHAVAVERAAGR